jgi:hypothetical protein
MAMLIFPVSWETFWRMIALIVTDQLRETSSGFDLLRWICRDDAIIKKESVVRMMFPSLAYQHRRR